MDIEKIANELARLMKGAGDTNADYAGDYAHFFDDAVYDDEGNGPIWTAVCDRAEQLLPSIVVTDEERASWSRATRECNAERNHERQQLGFGA